MTKMAGDYDNGRSFPETEPGEAFEKSKTRHGTISGWRKHQQDGTEPCTSCNEAKASYDKRWRDIPENTLRNRLNAKAQGRALTTLRKKYAVEYKALYDEAVTALLAEHGLERRYRRGRG